MARYFLLSLVFALISTVTFAQQASLSGKITDGDNGEELIAANVTLYKGGVLITGHEQTELLFVLVKQTSSMLPWVQG
jgi:hypothetical protein